MNHSQATIVSSIEFAQPLLHSFVACTLVTRLFFTKAIITKKFSKSKGSKSVPNCPVRLDVFLRQTQYVFDWILFMWIPSGSSC